MQPTTSATRTISRRTDLEARYARLFEMLRRPAKGMVRRAFGSAFSEDELDDLYSGAWVSTLAAFERKPRDLTDEDLRRYVMTAVANQASREMRRRGRKPTLPIEVALEAADPTVGPDEAATQAEQTRITREVLGSLPPRRRAVMLFRYGWGLEPNEVCGIVDGLSPRAYRKEVERGVAEVVSKMRLVEDGDWCRSREPLLRAVAAGTADEEEERQARQHLAHCRSCTTFLSKLSGHLHDLSTPFALMGAAESLHLGGPSLLDRAGEVVDRGKQTITGLVTRGTDGAEQAVSQVMASGGSRGAGVAGAGALAKVAGLGAVPKIVAACVGTGAAATACVAAGVVPGVNVERESSNRPAASSRELPRDRTDLVRHKELGAIRAAPVTEVPPRPVSEGVPETSPAPEPAGSNSGPVIDEAAPPSAPPPAQPSPTTQEFEPVGAPVSQTSTPDRSGTGGGGSAPEADFGP